MDADTAVDLYCFIKIQKDKIDKMSEISYAKRKEEKKEG